MFTSTSINLYNPDYITIQWEYTPEDIENTFKIFVSESPDGGFDDLSGDMSGDTGEFSTDKINLNNLTRTLYFKIRCINPSGKEIWSDTFANFPNQPTRVAAHIVERHYLQLKFLNGIQSALYIRKTMGIRCPNCWDPISKRSNKSKCPECYGTTWLGGFYDPIKIWVNYSPIQKTQIKSQIGTTDAMESSGWTAGFPVVTPGSIIMEMNETARRWQVVQVAFKEFNRVPVRQIMTIQELRKDAIENKLPLPSLSQFEEHNIWKKK
ncbi:MAG: hypothetical protein SVK08_01865 [Halobacteriota archaeon]|nr:hypothetical protein [Halobacteriota archaeon]